MPSDYIGEVSECIDKKNYEVDLRNVVEKFITVHKIVTHYISESSVRYYFTKKLVKWCDEKKKIG